MLIRARSLVLSCAAVLVVCGSSRAAEAPEDTVLHYQLPEIVVTGSRIREPIQSTAASITLVDRSRFADGRGLSLKEALLFVPGVFAQSRSGAGDTRITIRGFGARGNGERSNAGVIRGIRVLTDGIPVSEPDGRTALDLADLGSADELEVSRSNASALYGNASGGVINLKTNLDFTSPYAQLRGRAGSFGYHREQAAAGFVAGQTRGIFSLANQNLDGWRDHSGASASVLQGRVLVPLDARTRLNLLLDGVSDLNRYPGPLTRAQMDSAAGMANPHFASRDERRQNRIVRVAATLDRDWNDRREMQAALWIEPKVLKRSERNRFRDFNRVHLGGSATFVQRARLGTDFDGAFSAGVDEAWQDGSILFYSLTPTGGRGTDLVANKREAANSAGAFGQFELKWRDRWALRLAGRYDDVYYLAEDFIDPHLDADHTFRRWTPKASVAWLAGDHTLFAALGGGVEAPAFNEIDPPAPFDTTTSFNPFLKTTHSTTGEIGARGVIRRWLDLKYDAAIYWIDVANDFVPYDGGAYFFTVGKSRRQGVELALDWSPIDRLSLGTAVHLSRNRYRSYSNELGDYGGHRIAGLPERVISARGRYALRQGWYGEVGVEAVGPYFADDANTARASAYTLVNARGGWAGVLDGRMVRAFVGVDNLADTKHVSSVFINGLNGEYYEPGLPRNWSAGLTIGF